MLKASAAAVTAVAMTRLACNFFTPAFGVAGRIRVASTQRTCEREPMFQRLSQSRKGWTSAGVTGSRPFRPIFDRKLVEIGILSGLPWVPRRSTDGLRFVTGNEV